MRNIVGQFSRVKRNYNFEVTHQVRWNIGKKGERTRMTLMHKALEDVTSEDIQQLIDHGVAESHNIEYKRELPGKTDACKRELLNDICAFANAVGGEILYGVDCENGIPTLFEGVQSESPDDEILRLENIARDCISPRITNLHCRAVEVTGSGKFVFIVRIPNTFNPPHMVTYLGKPSFFKRNSLGKHPMDVFEIRNSAVQSSSIMNDLISWRQLRLNLINSNHSPTMIPGGAKIILHLIPLSSVSPQKAMISLRRARAQKENLPLLYSDFCNLRFNFEGVFTVEQMQENCSHGYVQLFRTGQVESVDTRLLNSNRDEEPEIPVRHIMKEVLDSTQKYLECMRNVGIQLPIVFSLTLSGIRNYKLQSRFNSGAHVPIKISKDNLLLPEVVIENWEPELSQETQPVWDTLWNAYGFERCLYYTEEGILSQEEI